MQIKGRETNFSFTLIVSLYVFTGYCSKVIPLNQPKDSELKETV